MALREDIRNKIKAILDEKFEVKEVSYVPKLDDPKLTFGNTGLKFEATVLFIDMRGSTQILNNHNKTTVAKIHMAYFHTIVKITNSLGGDVRSFNGDSALIFFQGTTKTSLSTAVEAAMKIRFMLTDTKNGIAGLLSKYTEIDFGIGIDDGKILCTKVGIGGEHNRDLFWVGNAVNKATVLGNESSNPNYIFISKYVYDNLLDYVKYGEKENLWGDKVQVDMWQEETFKYNNNWETYYYTSWYMEI